MKPCCAESAVKPKSVNQSLRHGLWLSQFRIMSCVSDVRLFPFVL